MAVAKPKKSKRRRALLRERKEARRIRNREFKAVLLSTLALTDGVAPYVLRDIQAMAPMQIIHHYWWPAQVQEIIRECQTSESLTRTVQERVRGQKAPT